MKRVLGLVVVGLVAFAPSVEANQKKSKTRPLTTAEIANNICLYRRSGMSVEKLHARAKAQLNQGTNVDRAVVGLNATEAAKYRYEHNMATIGAASQIVEIAIVNPSCQPN